MRQRTVRTGWGVPHGVPSWGWAPSRAPSSAPASCPPSPHKDEMRTWCWSWGGPPEGPACPGGDCGCWSSSEAASNDEGRLTTTDADPDELMAACWCSALSEARDVMGSLPSGERAVCSRSAESGRSSSRAGSMAGCCGNQKALVTEERGGGGGTVAWVEEPLGAIKDPLSGTSWLVDRGGRFGQFLHPHWHYSI